jgi:hypothetical protein
MSCPSTASSLQQWGSPCRWSFHLLHPPEPGILADFSGEDQAGETLQQPRPLRSLTASKPRSPRLPVHPKWPSLTTLWTRGAALELRWSCCGAAVELLSNCSGSAGDLLESYGGTAVEPSLNCYGAAVGLLWGCSGDTDELLLELLWSSGGRCCGRSCGAAAEPLWSCCRAVVAAVAAAAVELLWSWCEQLWICWGPAGDLLGC